MTTFKSVEEILDFAIKSEEEAEAFYTGLAAKTESKGMKEAFLSFAKEEAGHRCRAGPPARRDVGCRLHVSAREHGELVCPTHLGGWPKLLDLLSHVSLLDVILAHPTDRPTRRCASHSRDRTDPTLSLIHISEPTRPY